MLLVGQENYIDGYWGKAQPRIEIGPQGHPLAYHSLDVAAIADALLERSPRKLTLMAAHCYTSPETLRRFFLVLIALHDIGKFSRHFQAKSDIGWQADILGNRPEPRPGVRHDAIGYAMFDENRPLVESANLPLFPEHAGLNRRVGCEQHDAH